MTGDMPGNDLHILHIYFEHILLNAVGAKGGAGGAKAKAARGSAFALARGLEPSVVLVACLAIRLPQSDRLMYKEGLLLTLSQPWSTEHCCSCWGAASTLSFLARSVRSPHVGRGAIPDDGWAVVERAMHGRARGVAHGVARGVERAMRERALRGVDLALERVLVQVAQLPPGFREQRERLLPGRVADSLVGVGGLVLLPLPLLPPLLLLLQLLLLLLQLLLPLPLLPPLLLLQQLLLLLLMAVVDHHRQLLLLLVELLLLLLGRQQQYRSLRWSVPAAASRQQQY
jgi:hypothetical protein